MSRTQQHERFEKIVEDSKEKNGGDKFDLEFLKEAMKNFVNDALEGCPAAWIDRAIDDLKIMSLEVLKRYRPPPQMRMILQECISGKYQRSLLTHSKKWWDENLPLWLNSFQPRLAVGDGDDDAEAEELPRKDVLVEAVQLCVAWLNEKIDERFKMAKVADAEPAEASSEEVKAADLKERAICGIKRRRLNDEFQAEERKSPEHGTGSMATDGDGAEVVAELPGPAAAELVNVAHAMQTDKDGDAEAEEVVAAGENDGCYCHVIGEHDFFGLHQWASARTALQNQEYGPDRHRLFFFRRDNSNGDKCLIPVRLKEVMEGGKMNSGYVYIFPLEEGLSVPADPVGMSDIFTAMQRYHNTSETKDFYKLPELHNFVLACAKLRSKLRSRLK